MSKHIRYFGRYQSGVLNGAAAADSSTGGRFWIVNHPDPTNDLLLAVTRIEIVGIPPVGTSISITQVTAERMSFTGIPSGAVGAPVAIRTAAPLPTYVSVRTASTGMSITAGEVIGATVLPITVGTPDNVYGASARDCIFDYPAGMEFRPGEGLVVRQADAGSTDQRFMVAVDFFVYTV